MQDTFEQILAKRKASQGQSQSSRAPLVFDEGDDDELYQEELKKTPVGRQVWRETWRRKQLTAVEEKLADKALTPKAKEALGVLRDYIKSPDYGKLPAKHGQDIEYVNEDGMKVSGGTDRARSFAEGFANSLPQLLDLPPAIAQKALGKLGVQSDALDAARNMLRQGQAAVTEKLDARTPSGEAEVIKFIGGLSNPATLKGYGKIAEVTGKVMAKGAGKVGLKGVEKLITTGQQSASMLERAETNVMTGLPLNAAQVFGQMPEGASKEEKLKQLAFGIAADALGGAVFMQKPSGFKGGDVPVQAPKKGEAAPVQNKQADEILKKLETKSAETAQKEAAEEEVRVYNSNARTMAAAEWQQANMGKKWMNLDKEQRKAIVEEWKKNKPIEWFREQVNNQNAQAAPAEAPQAPLPGVQNSIPTEIPPEVLPPRAGAVSSGSGISPAQIDAVVADAIAAKAAQTQAPPAPELPAPVAPKELTMAEQLAAFQAKKAAARQSLETATAMDAEVLNSPAAMSQALANGDVSAIPTLDELNSARKLIYDFDAAGYSRQGGRSLEEVQAVDKAIKLLRVTDQVHKQAGELFPHDNNAYMNATDIEPWRVDHAEKRVLDLVEEKTKKLNYENGVKATGYTEKQIEDAASKVRVLSYGSERTFNTSTQKQKDELVKAFEIVDKARANGAIKNLEDEQYQKALNIRQGKPPETPVTAATPEPVVAPPAPMPVTPSAVMDAPPVVPDVITPPVPAAPALTTRAELESLEDKLLNKLSALEKAWTKANPGKNLREMKNWDNAEYIETRKRFSAVSTQLENMPDEAVSALAPSVGAQVVAPDPALEGLTIRPQIIDPAANTVVRGKPLAPKSDIPPAQFDIKRARSPRKLNDDELNQAIDSVQGRIDGLDAESDKQYMKILESLIEEQSTRAVANEMRGQVNMPPGVAGAGLGFTYGVVTSDPDDPDAASRVLMWTLAGAAAGYGAGRYAKQNQIKALAESKLSNLFPGQAALKAKQAKIVSVEDKVEAKQPFEAMMRNFYNGAVRRVANFENLVGKLPVQSMEPLRNMAVKFAEHFNRSIARTESWMHQAIVVDGLDGEPVYIGPTYLGEDVKPAQQILAGVQNDKAGLSEVMVALSSLELQARGMMNTPFDAAYATLVVKNAPDNYIQAAREFRKFNLAMLKVMQLAGRIDDKVFNNLAQEEWYTPLYRMVEGGATKNIRDLKKNRLSVRDPLKARQGGSKQLDVIDPVDQTLTLLPYVLRHHEYSQWVQSTLDLIRQQPAPVQRALMKRVKSTDSETIKNIEQTARELRDTYDLSPTEAERLLAFKDQGDNARGGGGFITHWEDGVLSTYKVDDVIFDTAKSLLPFERDILNNALFKGARATTRLATKGVVLNPIFVAKQFIMDTIEAGITSKYGFVPVVDSVRGWWAIASRSPEYLRAVDMGGLGAIQSLPYQNAASAEKAFAAEGNSALAVGWNHMKELHPIEAYKALALPIAESSRMGEFLRARGHGASTLEGVFAAREVGFNVSMEGSFTAIRALHQLTMFTRPGIQAMDALARAAARNPARFLATSLAYITVPSAALWWAYKDDKEIQKWRRTQVGKNYWFIRDFGGDVMRIRKPHILGQVFGTAVEEAFDQAHGKDPQVKELMRAVYKDASVNMLPLFGTIPLSIIADKDFSELGDMRPITPQGDVNLERKFQGRDRASLPARIISDVTANVVTPAQTSYLINQVSTTLGADFAQGATLVQDYIQNKYVPAKYELPIIRSVYANKRGQGEEVYKFYNTLEEIEKRVNTANYLMQPGELAKNPQAYAEYYRENIKYILLSDTYSAARTDISNYRRVLEDLKKMKHLVPQSTLDRVEMQYLNMIEQRASAANMAGQMIK